ncbi:hypothetical protein XENTR_v10003593 [Xenopus tropicalis]|nr:hypothetical protein XENTR_v10003593 [Xenopus tropicalis]|eukprot:XP_002942630.2 PREDICTED: insulin-like growth factor-binding protein 4 [Xenopus tropicalis]
MMSGNCHPALLLLVLATFGMAEDAAIQCPPCSQEKLIRCTDPVGCQELVKEPGCGCCATCALPKGAPCGVYTARCGTGLRCYPPRGSEKPLHTLMHGQGLCTEIGEIESITETFPKTEEDHPNISIHPCGQQDKMCIQKHQAKIHRSQGQSGKQFTKNTNNAPVPEIHLGVCQKDLNRALEKLAAYQTRTQEDFLSIPIPNCDRNGNYNPKQCHPALDGQRGKCWCVDRKTGVKLHIPYDPVLDADCQVASERGKE